MTQRRYPLRGKTEITCAPGEDYPLECVARIGRSPVARMLLLDEGRERLVVKWAHVAANLQGKGVAQDLYLAAARAACERGRRLSSDVERSSAAEYFWLKQQERGHARCIGPRETARETDYELDRISDDWPCERYELRCPPPARLAGIRRRLTPRRRPR